MEQYFSLKCHPLVFVTPEEEPKGVPPHLDDGLVTAIHIAPIQSVQTDLTALQERNVQRNKLKREKRRYMYVLGSSHSSACMESAGAT